MPNAQQAVWRNGGCNSAESAVRNRTLVPRMTGSVPRHCAKPPPRYVQAASQRWTKTYGLERETQRKGKTREAVRAGKFGSEKYH